MYRFFRNPDALDFSIAGNEDFNPLPFIEKAALEGKDRILIDEPAPQPAPAPKKEDEPGKGPEPQPEPKGQLKIDDDDYFELVEKAAKGKKATEPEPNPNPEPDPEKDKKPAAPAATPFAILYNDLVESGEWEADDEFDGSEESFQQIKQKNLHREIETGIQMVFEKALKNNPEGYKAKALIQHMAAGGRVADFQEVYSAPDYSEDMLEVRDGNDEEVNAIAADISAQYYSSIGWDAERIKKRIAHEKKLGILVDSAKDLLPEYNKLKQENQQVFLAEQLEQQKRREQEAAQFNNGITELIKKGGVINGVEIKNDRKTVAELQEYMFGRTVELNGMKVSPYYAALVEASKKPEFVLFQAMLLKNGLKLDGLQEKAEKAAKNQLRDRIEEYARHKGIGGAGGTGTSVEQKQKGGNSMGIDFDNLVEQFL